MSPDTALADQEIGQGGRLAVLVPPPSHLDTLPSRLVLHYQGLPGLLTYPIRPSRGICHEGGPPNYYTCHDQHPRVHKLVSPLLDEKSAARGYHLPTYCTYNRHGGVAGWVWVYPWPKGGLCATIVILILLDR
jgi:hypothetical protein